MNPDFSAVEIDPAKIADYLLSSSHPTGRFKAHVFRVLGYSPEQWQRLDADLRQLVRSGACAPGRPTAYGQKWEVSGSVVGPSGRSARLVTVWLVAPRSDLPRLITAFPG
jgi:hypothetical protein